jgi:hypothetical protein
VRQTWRIMTAATGRRNTAAQGRWRAALKLLS